MQRAILIRHMHPYLEPGVEPTLAILIDHRVAGATTSEGRC